MSPLNLEAEQAHFHQLRRDKFLVPRPQNVPKHLIRQLGCLAPTKQYVLADNIDRPFRPNKHGKGSTPSGMASAKLILTGYGTALIVRSRRGGERDWRAGPKLNQAQPAFAAANSAVAAPSRPKLSS